jgi:RNA polymerase sigma-70 factor (ECF subfamily)
VICRATKSAHLSPLERTEFSALATSVMSTFADASADANLPEAAGSAVEAQLVQATLAGDQAAFANLVQLHGRRVFHFLLRMTRQSQDAEDLAQQTFIKAYRSLHRFDTNRPFVSWLLTIARRTALNHFRGARAWDEMPEQVESNEPSPASVAEERDQVDDIWETARRRLSQREFEVMWLRYGENLSVAETARVAGLTKTHVKILVFRARQRLTARGLAS